MEGVSAPRISGEKRRYERGFVGDFWEGIPKGARGIILSELEVCG